MAKVFGWLIRALFSVLTIGTVALLTSIATMPNFFVASWVDYQNEVVKWFNANPILSSIAIISMLVLHLFTYTPAKLIRFSFALWLWRIAGACVAAIGIIVVINTVQFSALLDMITGYELPVLLSLAGLVFICDMLSYIPMHKSKEKPVELAAPAEEKPAPFGVWKGDAEVKGDIVAPALEADDLHRYPK